MSWNPWQRSKAGVDTSPNKQNDEEPQQVDLSHQLTRFLNTNEGLQWLGATLDSVEQGIIWATSPPSLVDINKAVLSKFRDFMDSESGKRMASQLQHEMNAGTLMVPVVVLEELIKQRLRAIAISLVTHNLGRYLRFFCVRAAVASVLFHTAKEGVKRAARRCGNRVSKTVDFVLDVGLPTGFFGPALGVTVGVLQLAGIIRLPMARPAGNEGDKPGAGGAQGTPQSDTVAGDEERAAAASAPGVSVGAGAGGDALATTGARLLTLGNTLSSGQFGPTAGPGIQSSSPVAQVVGAAVGMRVESEEVASEEGGSLNATSKAKGGSKPSNKNR